MDCDNTWPFRVQTARPVALNSYDHTHPVGTLHDNSLNLDFNRQLTLYLCRRGLPQSVLDLGCAGGGMVRTLVEAGYQAVGIEGSDLSQKLGRAEWSVIPKHLFTADATAPFQVESCASAGWVPMRFSAITAWEFLEHIAEPDLPVLFDNIHRHLVLGGVLIVSIFTRPDPIWEHYHQTVRSWDWWVRRMGQAGLLYDWDATLNFMGAWVRQGPWGYSQNGIFRK